MLSHTLSKHPGKRHDAARSNRTPGTKQNRLKFAQETE